MHSFSRNIRKYKKIITAIIFILVVILINELIGFAYVQTGLTRIIVHELDSCNDYECVILGQSHSSYGIDTKTIDKKIGLKTMNMSAGGQNMIDMYYYVKEVYAHNNPQVVILDLDLEYFNNVPKEKYTYANTLMYYEYPFSIRKIEYSWDKLMSKDIRAFLFPWNIQKANADLIKLIIKSKMTREYRNYDIKSVTKIRNYDKYYGGGHIYRERTYSNSQTFEEANTYIVWDNPDQDESIEYFNKIIKLCTEKGSKIILISSPINTETLIRSRDEYDKANKYIQKLADDNKLIYYNFNLVKPELFTRTNEDYYDYDGHFYGDSAQRYSDMLGEFLTKVIDGQEDTSDYFYSDIYEIYEEYLEGKIIY